ncbi:Molybdate-binding periplasmic protein precursor [Thalassovita gelatinovora]|uniref:Molybdate-binding periplasmic protein n=1 Tax=Thalassovita gelatinovora TaxID=53501 RepID=A0A0P1F8Q1_THAGE|nr:molybdate ABC transporter substrate-binding protein [Thalassovita gelatinovora]QIZ80380.1 molybdate ABC transporter substrate-binding protein [Thalassovita gelatinovora]CUH64347.1 Molybdate-binding periplasmic protein precursor [Thalassovita gelatinovora]SEQ92971.1 molybdate transport system substrate-binding protein [Thalassovita gelatinovora]
MTRKLSLAFALFLFFLFPLAASAGQVTVFAAASMKTALEDVAADWQRQSGHKATLSFAGSSALARQIEAGAPADLYLSANSGWMDRLEEQGLLRSGSRSDLLGNQLVLVGPAGTAPQPLDSTLIDALEGGHLAMALVEAVPAGIYGKAALEYLGLWTDIAPHVAQADNVRAALALVAIGEAPLGIVYATDAQAEPRVDVVAEFPAPSHPPITYPVAILTDSKADTVQAFLDYLKGPVAKKIFLRHGFTEPPQHK